MLADFINDRDDDYGSNMKQFSSKDLLSHESTGQFVDQRDKDQCKEDDEDRHIKC